MSARQTEYLSKVTEFFQEATRYNCAHFLILRRKGHKEFDGVLVYDSMALLPTINEVKEHSEIVSVHHMDNM